MKRFEGKGVLVTGASSGIGAEIARCFAKEGASLCITGRNAENLKKVASECTEHGSPKVVEVIADLADIDAFLKAIKDGINNLETLDVLVNNAGFYEIGKFEAVTMGDYDKQFDVNMKAPFFLTQSLAPNLKKTKGCVVNISTILTESPYPGFLIYGMTKATLDYFTRGTALELAPSGVRVNSVGPGYVKTNVRAKELSKEERDKFYDDMAGVTPLGKIPTTENIADAVLFLASDAASMITGMSLFVDGGVSLK